jgi:hypothetical protein
LLIRDVDPALGSRIQQVRYEKEKEEMFVSPVFVAINLTNFNFTRFIRTNGQQFLQGFEKESFRIQGKIITGSRSGSATLL